MANQLIEQIQSLAPDATFLQGDSFCWSPNSSAITFSKEALDTESGLWSLLHEVSHSLLGHYSYQTDFELVMLEATAWDKAKELAASLGIQINENHVQDCLDTYRDWLHRRSMCPACSSVSLQESPTLYRCHNCHVTWNVTSARFCRPYRKLRLKS